MAEIKVKDLRKDFNDFTAVKSSSFTVANGEFLMLLGPSGCGKTTTLRMIAGLELPTSGEIFIDGEEVGRQPASKRDIAMVFQLFALYPHMNVRRNISYPLVSQGMPKAEIKQKVAEVTAILGIEDLLNSSVSKLSGGDRQRVALGRAIVRNPKAFMMDEPLGALDAEFRERMAEELRNLHDRMEATTVYVTHDQLEAMQMGDKIVVMNHGVIEQFGVPQDIYDKPASMFVADFVGSPSMNFLGFMGSIEAGENIITVNDLPIAVPKIRESISGELVLGVRPEQISFSDSSKFRGEVTSTEYLGTTQIIIIQGSDWELKVRAPADQTFKIGENVGCEFKAETLSLFDRKTGRALQTDLNEGVH